MGKVAAGRLNRRVSLQRKVLSQDDWGQPLEVWQDVATVWAHIKTVRGAEFIAGGAEVSEATASIRIRRRADLDAAMRVVYGGQAYDIRAVLPDEEGMEYVDLAVSVGASEG